jgi:hypothetical protein
VGDCDRCGKVVDGVYLYLALVLGIAEAFFLLDLRRGVLGLLIVVVVQCIHSLYEMLRCQEDSSAVDPLLYR